MAGRGIRGRPPALQAVVALRTLDEDWNGPSAVRPIIQLRTLLDGGTAMTVAQADYADPDRWWL